MNSLRFKTEQLTYLAHLLQCREEEIKYLCEHIANYYNKWVEKKINAKTGLPKTYPDGTVKKRTIRPSLFMLKKIQKRIKTTILDKVILPPNILGGVKGKTNILNAKLHQGNKYIFCTDLQEFFPGINHRQIHNMFLKLGYSQHVAHWLTKLTSIEFELPQGTPTSTAIANIVFLPVDKRLIALCKTAGITYTRYVDDLTFSSPKDFRPLISEMLSYVTETGFKISYRKTSYQGEQLITGIKVHNNYIDSPDKIKKKVLAEAASNAPSKPCTSYHNRIINTNTTSFLKRSEHKKNMHDTNRKNSS